jgi:hypothetical protein
MLSQLLIAWALMALCVVIHSTGVVHAARWLRRAAMAANRLSQGSWLLVRLAGWMIVLHLIEITVWSLVYAWSGAMADMPSALYFSAVTYTTTGYGDLVLPQDWRLVAPSRL